MAKKRTLSDLIKDEFQQQSLKYIDAYKEESGSDWVIDSCYRADKDLPIKQKKGSCVPEIKGTHEQTHEPAPLCWVQTYWVCRHGVKHQYYRFCYLKNPDLIGSCVRVHLPGGNTKSGKAIFIKERVTEAIALGNSPSQIIALIKSGK